MAKFECDSCGRCCASFGQFIRIERQLNDRDYYCRYGITNEIFPVHVLPEYAGEFADEFEVRPDLKEIVPQNQCMFMRKNKAGKGFACIIYPSRPKVCRDFRCHRMLIYNSDGCLCGRILGRSDLKTTDDELAHLWKEKIASLAHNDDISWEREVIALLSLHGYKGDPVE
jgi:Fe-S-cluster containining protein